MQNWLWHERSRSSSLRSIGGSEERNSEISDHCIYDVPGMSTLNTPLSDFEGTPLSAVTSFSAFTTPQSHRQANASPSSFPSTTRRTGGQSSHILSMYSTQDR